MVFFLLLSFLAFIMMWVLISGHRSVSLMPLGCWAGKDGQAEGVGEGCSSGSNHHVPASLSACAFPQLQRCPAAFLGASSEFSLFLGLWSPFIYFLKNCLGHSTSPFSAKINASSLPIINEVIFYYSEKWSAATITCPSYVTLSVSVPTQYWAC